MKKKFRHANVGTNRVITTFFIFTRTTPHTTATESIGGTEEGIPRNSRASKPGFRPAVRKAAEGRVVLRSGKLRPQRGPAAILKVAKNASSRGPASAC
jgi:hypothetical protein